MHWAAVASSNKETWKPSWVPPAFEVSNPADGLGDIRIARSNLALSFKAGKYVVSYTVAVYVQVQ